MPGSPVLIRYADDLVALCHTRDEAEQVKARLAGWLAPRGLAFNEDKTRIVTLDDGFDFLGFNVRRYRGKLLIKPSKAALRRIRERLRTEMRALRGANAAAVLATAQPDHPGLGGLLPDGGVQRGVHRAGRYLWRLTYKWAKHGHPNKPKHWVVNRYFGTFNKSRQDRWVFGDRDSGAYLHQVRLDQDRPTPDGQGHGVPGRPALAEYWADRRRRSAPRRWTSTACICSQPQARAAARSAGTCSCTPTTSHKPHTEWEQWLRATRKALRKQSHHLPATRQRRTRPTASVSYTLDAAGSHAAAAADQHFCTAREPSGLA